MMRGEDIATASNESQAPTPAVLLPATRQRLVLLSMAGILLVAGVGTALVSSRSSGSPDTQVAADITDGAAPAAADAQAAKPSAQAGVTGLEGSGDAAQKAAAEIRGGADSREIAAAHRERLRNRAGPVPAPERPPARSAPRPAGPPAQPRARQARPSFGAIATSPLLQVANQAPGLALRIGSVTARAQGAFVVVFADEGGAVGRELGREELDGGFSGATSVGLDRRLADGAAVWVVLHQAQRTFPDDEAEVGAPVVDGGRVVRSRVLIQASSK